MESKRSLSGPNSEEKPEKKKYRMETDEDNLLALGGGDVFDEEEIDRILAPDSEAERPGNENKDEFETPRTSPFKGERSKRAAPMANMDNNMGGLERKLAGVKRQLVAGGRGETKKKKRNEMSEFLLTIFGREDQGGRDQKDLLQHLNNKVFQVVAERSQDFLPKINFTRFQEAESRTLVGCADRGTVEWVKAKVLEYDPGLEVWDRESLAVFHTYIPSPTSSKSSQEIIQALQYINSIPGRMLPLKMEETRNGKVLIVGMTEPAAQYVTERGDTLFCGLAKVTMTRMKPKHGEAMDGK